MDWTISSLAKRWRGEERRGEERVGEKSNIC
jgi:hypothetical protein